MTINRQFDKCKDNQLIKQDNKESCSQQQDNNNRKHINKKDYNDTDLNNNRKKSGRSGIE